MVLSVAVSANIPSFFPNRKATIISGIRISYFLLFAYIPVKMIHSADQKTVICPMGFTLRRTRFNTGGNQGLNGLLFSNFKLPGKTKTLKFQHFSVSILPFQTVCGTPGRSRTCDLQSRSLTLYPAELRAHTNDSIRLYL